MTRASCLPPHRLMRYIVRSLLVSTIVSTGVRVIVHTVEYSYNCTNRLLIELAVNIDIKKFTFINHNVINVIYILGQDIHKIHFPTIVKLGLSKKNINLARPSGFS